MAKLTAAQLLASQGPITVKVPVADGWSVPLSVRVTGTSIDVDDLAAAALGDTPQKLDKAGQLGLKGPKLAYTAGGKLTGLELPQSAKRPPQAVVALLYTHVGLEVPEPEPLPSPIQDRMGPQLAGEPVNGDKPGKGKGK